MYWSKKQTYIEKRTNVTKNVFSFNLYKVYIKTIKGHEFNKTSS